MRNWMIICRFLCALLTLQASLNATASPHLNKTFVGLTFSARNLDWMRQLSDDGINIFQNSCDTEHVRTMADIIIAERLLAKKGFPTVPLENPILKRGDARGPDGPNGIFKKGFERRSAWGEPNIDDSGRSRNVVATTKDTEVAIGFANNPGDTQHFFSPRKEETGWVYLIYSKEGVDLVASGIKFKPSNNIDLPKVAREVDVLGVPPEHVIAALQIKTTPTEIVYYCMPFYKIPRFWYNIVLDFRINPNAELPEDFDASAAVAEFAEIYLKSMYRISYAPPPNLSNENELVGHLQKTIIQKNPDLSRLEVARITDLKDLKKLAGENSLESSKKMLMIAILSASICGLGILCSAAF